MQAGIELQQAALWTEQRVSLEHVPAAAEVVELVKGLEGKPWDLRNVWMRTMIEEYAQMYVILLPHMRQGKFRKGGVETFWRYDFLRREPGVEISEAAQNALQEMKRSNECSKRKTGVFVLDPQMQPYLFYNVHGNRIPFTELTREQDKPWPKYKKNGRNGGSRPAAPMQVLCCEEMNSADYQQMALIPVRGALSEVALGNRLRKEYTYVQSGENELEMAVKCCKTAQDLPLLFPQRKVLILQSVSTINRIRLQLGSTAEQQGLSMVQAVARLEENEYWRRLSPNTLTPLQSMVSLRGRGRGIHRDVGKALRLTTGLLAGETFWLSELPRPTAQFWQTMVPIFNNFISTMNELVNEVLDSTSHGNPQTIHSLATFFSEHWTLNTLLEFAAEDTTSEEIFKRLSPSLSLPTTVWIEIIGCIQLTRLQLEQCLQARNRYRTRALNQVTEKVAVEDLISSLCNAQHLSAGSPLFCAEEALRRNGLEWEAIRVGAAHELMFGIFTPQQTACCTHLIRLNMQELVPHWDDWMQIFHGCMMNGWMDIYVPQLSTECEDVTGGLP